MANYEVGVNGLVPAPSAQTSIPAVQWAAAAGTANALTAAYNPAITALTDGLIVGLRALLASTSTTVTFSPDPSIAAVSIKKKGNQSLAVGDIANPGHELLLRYNLAGNRFELLNPAS